MSDVKAKRAGREAARHPAVSAEPVPPQDATSDMTQPAADPVAPGAIEAPPQSTSPAPSLTTAEPAVESPDPNWGAFAAAQAALARGFEALTKEFTGLTQSGLAVASDAAVAMLGARTLAELVEINAGLSRRGIDAMIEGTARLSDIGIKTATEASRPILARFVAS